MKKLRKNKKGFTLVELVVVIAILAILASTATVATIAILNNARKTPVQDAAGNLKNQINLYFTMDDYKDTLTATGSNKGFVDYIKDSMPEITVDTTAKTTVTAPNGDGIYLAVSKTSGLKSSTWTAIVYTKYYKCTITCTYDSTNKSMGVPQVGAVEKI